jgi:TM2 domain-containing membrane protein YozV
MAESANKPGDQPKNGTRPAASEPEEPGPTDSRPVEPEPADSQPEEPEPAGAQPGPAMVPMPPDGPEPGFATTLPSHQPDPTTPASPLDPTAAFPATGQPQPPPMIPPVPPAVAPFPAQSSAYGEAGVAPEAGTAPAWPAPAPPSPPVSAAPGYPPPSGYPPQYDPATGRPLSDKSRIVAGLLQIFLGSFGIGRFYTGHTGIAVAQLVVSICTLGIGGVWGLVDGIILLVNGGTDAQGRVLRD